MCFILLCDNIANGWNSKGLCQGGKSLVQVMYVVSVALVSARGQRPWCSGSALSIKLCAFALDLGLTR